MAKSLLFGMDGPVARALFEKQGLPFLSYDRAVGIMDEQNQLVGVGLWQNWNTANVDFSYYGVGTLTMGLVRALAKYAITEFDASRVTVHVSKKRRRYLKTVLKFGFRYEGTQHCYYGKLDNARNTAVRLALFRKDLEKLARVETEQAA